MSNDLLSAITTTVTDIQERLSLAYLTAVAAQAGCQVLETKVDRNGVDATIRPVAGAPDRNGYSNEISFDRHPHPWWRYVVISA
jgi:hypothetical protein